MLYDMSSSVIEALERITSRQIRKWICILPTHPVSPALDCTDRAASCNSLVEEFKTDNTRLVLKLKYSADKQIRVAGLVTPTSRI
ncbi:hypothetical protein DPMN_029568 [Dreissena polymorpha]|uniref:Uncharacterized protein n=1 Tax=Dreissena polymorpha TaxID=45954 RepID=A0A9D4RFL1_DREPO|nr:hypothetical protein DPMN_029568 [Dreissena polymorpha]